jgi:hypothetical protein
MIENQLELHFLLQLEMYTMIPHGLERLCTCESGRLREPLHSVQFETQNL